VIIHNVAQRSEEWARLRWGKFTATDFGDLMPTPKQGPNDWNKAQLKIIYLVASERMTGFPDDYDPDRYLSKAVEHGKSTEFDAAIDYEMNTGRATQEVGFVEYSEWIGCSPDRLVGDDGGLEIKCPNSDTHLRYVTEPGSLEADYEYQCHGGMLCTGREWWDLLSYDPRFTIPSKRFYLVRIHRDEAIIEAMKARLDLAVEKVKSLIA